MNIKLSDCPAILQKAVEEKVSDYDKWFGSFEIISVTRFESTPYKDKSIISTQYQVIVFTANFFKIFECAECTEEHFNIGVSSNSLTIGCVKEIIDHVPEWAGLRKPAFAPDERKATV